MDWPPRTGSLGPDPYPNPRPGVYPPESSFEHEYQNHPPANPPWALRSGFGATDAPTYSNPGGGVSLYPPSQEYEDYPPKASWVESCSDPWKSHTHSTSSSFDPEPYPNGGTIAQPFPHLQSSASYPPPSASENSPNKFPSHGEHSPADFFAPAPPPHVYPSPSAPPPQSDCPPVYPSASNAAPSWCASGVQGHTSSAPNLPGGSGLSFGCKPLSAHPLLHGGEDDFVPYEEGGDDQSDGAEEVEAGYGEEFDYSHEALEKYGVNLTTIAKEGSLDPVIGRDLVVRQCIEILTRKSKCNPVLVGHPGVGKTAVVEGLAQLIVKGDVPEPLRECKIISLDVGSITAGTQYRGQFEERMKEVIDEAIKAKRKVIIFLDELHRLIGSGQVEGSTQTGSEILKPALARGEFLCVGATTYDEYTKFIEQDQALARRFQKVVVDPPSVEDTISILRGLKPRLESHHGISIADDALIEAVKLSERYIPDRFLPDKAIDLVDVSASKLKIGLISKPPILDEIDRAILQLDMERLSVAAASGQASQARLQQILSDLEGLKVRQTNLNRKWKKEKSLANRIVSLKEKITAVKTRSSPSSSVSGLESDGNESNDTDKVLYSCDSCHRWPITGPRYSHESRDVDLCRECHRLLLGGCGQFGLLEINSFHRVEPLQGFSCDGCLINPVVGNYYQNKYTNNILCSSCWCREMESHRSETLMSFIEYHSSVKGSQTNIPKDSATTDLKKLEARLEMAEKEWSEYQNSYKPLIHLEVTSITIAEVLSSRTGIPVTKMQASQMHQLLQLDVELHKRVIGQDEACNAIARAIQRSRAGLSDPKRPIASLMFMGPTGVGKTELAKALATHLFNSEDAMVRIDMSEYGDKSSISRLTGAAPGLVGYGSGGQLTTPVHRQPYSVVLFDEIEKADDDIFNIFLQILDDGRLTDSEGRVVSFTNTVIIMTSNVGAERIMEVATDSNAHGSKEEAYQVMKFQVMEAAREKYRPEFINRIDEFIVFQPLNREQICEIVKLQLERVSKRLQDRLINLQVSESALQLLSTMGYDPRYGARPVKRVIQQSIEDPLAQGILRGQYTGGCTVMVNTEFSHLGPNPSQQPQQKLTFYTLA